MTPREQEVLNAMKPDTWYTQINLRTSRQVMVSLRRQKKVKSMMLHGTDNIKYPEANMAYMRIDDDK